MIFRILSAVVLGAVFAGCVAPTEPAPLDTAEQAIVGGHDSTAADNFAVRITINGRPFGGGTLVAPNLVLTDRNVAQSADHSAGITSCSTYRTNNTGLAVAAGLSNDALTPFVPVVRIITDGSPTSCDNSLAFLELATPLTGIPIARLRLEDGPKLSEPVRTLGWGTSSTTGAQPNVRQTAEGQILLESGGNYQLQVSTLDLDPAFMLASSPVCSADAGGPLVDGNGDVLGVIYDQVSQSLDEAQDPANLFGACQGAFSLSAAPAKHVAFVERSFQEYGLMPWRTGQAAPPGDLGTTCVVSHDCNSNLCIDVGGTKQCSKTCTDSAECGAGSSCLATSTASVCVNDVVNPPSAPSCSAGAFAGHGAYAAWGLLPLLLAAARRRRR